jgi:tetratricopeptide (TPR) repeat protein
MARRAVLLFPLLIPLASQSQSTSADAARKAAQPGREMPVTTASKEALALFQQGRDHYANAEAALAAPVFEKAIQKDERFALAHAYRALSGGGLEVARKHVDRAVALADGVSEGEKLWIQAAKAQVYGDSAALIASDEALLAMYPDDKSIQLKVGNYWSAVGDWPRAAKHFERAAALDPNYAAAQNQLGYARMSLGDLPGAEKALRRYVEIRQNAPNAHN